jgi:hypothetical protein
MVDRNAARHSLDEDGEIGTKAAVAVVQLVEALAPVRRDLHTLGHWGIRAQATG